MPRSASPTATSPICAKTAAIPTSINPIFEARHWGITDGKDVAAGSYHRTHSGYAVSPPSTRRCASTSSTVAPRRLPTMPIHEVALRSAVQALGCEVTSNMTSLVVLNLPPSLAGREKELVQNARAKGFGIWPTLSEPVQVRIGILNQLSEAAITEIVRRFAAAMNAMGADVDLAPALNGAGKPLRRPPLNKPHRIREG
jgi:alanine-glyoxylate transaminase/serine-glyoxylate transaminase/serine-pyruvate transaminase